MRECTRARTCVCMFLSKSTYINVIFVHLLMYSKVLMFLFLGSVFVGCIVVRMSLYL